MGGLCVLPLNIINEKIFIFVWFWMILLAVVTGMFVVYRFVTLIGSKMRTNLIVWHGGRTTKSSDVEAILEPQSLNWFEQIGDWLLLHFIVICIKIQRETIPILKL